MGACRRTKYRPIVTKYALILLLGPVAKLPEGESQQQQIGNTLNRANADLVGTIMDNRVSIDFLNSLESQLIKDAGVMEESLERQQWLPYTDGASTVCIRTCDALICPDSFPQLLRAFLRGVL